MTSSTLSLLLAGNQLKRTARTGWFMRGIQNGEDVAAHTFGVAWTALLLANQIQAEEHQSFDMGRLLSMALLHDIPEGKTTDIPSPAWRLLPEGSKKTVEQGVMEQIVSGSDQADRLMALWKEASQKETAEAKLVHDADKLDMYLQAWQYEQQLGNRQLGEFWETEHQFHFSQSQAIYAEILANRHKSPISG